MAKGPWKKMRHIDDTTLGNALNNHAGFLRALRNATTMLLRERRLLLALHVAEVAAIVYLVTR